MNLANIAKLLGVGLGVAAGASGVVGAGAVAALRRSLPQTRGTLRLPGLQQPVQILRDTWGVPHIYAESCADLVMAQGFVHAQDRLWQMEFQRRLAYGRLAELFGRVALDTDRFMRILGFGRVARAEVQTLDDDSLAVLEAYVAGVNAFVQQHAGRLPPEFLLLGLRPEAWTPADVLAFTRVMALQLSGNWREEIKRARMLALVGEERMRALDPQYPEGAPLIVPAGMHYNAQIGAAALELAESVQQFLVEGDGQGSNNWVVSGRLSETGMPLLANDPHLAIQMPSLWYENHLCGGDIYVTGASIPGIPLVVIGHNERVAWGLTNGMNDVQDVYIEQFDPADSQGLRYRFGDQWETARLVREEIQIKGEADAHTEEVRITRHGPLITPFVPPSGNGQAPELLALRWTALEPGRSVRSLLGLVRSHDWDSFRAAAADWTVPPQNFVYADVDGNIGYILGGDIPLRAKGDGSLPVPGWTGEYEWQGVIPPLENPQCFNPPEGMIVTANNQIVGDDYPYPVPGEFLNGYRAARIRQMLQQTTHHNHVTFERIQGDVRSLPGLELAALAGRLPADDDLARRARDLLMLWNGDLTAESAAALLYTRLRLNILEAAYADVSGALAEIYGLGFFAALPGEAYMRRALPLVLRRIAEREDAWLLGKRTWDDVLAQAWRGTLNTLRLAYGDDLTQWRYGAEHTLSIRHPLGAVPGLNWLFNRGPFATGGDDNTVCMGQLPHVVAGAPYYIAPSYRQICDPGDWNRSLSIHPTGQSGHPLSPHYDDFIQPWLKVDYHPMPWSRASVEEVTVDRLTLEA